MSRDTQITTLFYDTNENLPGQYVYFLGARNAVGESFSNDLPLEVAKSSGWIEFLNDS